MIVSVTLEDDFIARLADFIIQRFPPPERDFSSLAVVFGGRRPALFLKKELASRVGSAFCPPRFFSIDEFVDELLSRQVSFLPLSEMDACYVIYRLAQQEAPQILKGRSSFGRFLPWAREILNFFQQLDLEGKPSKEDRRGNGLDAVRLKAEIGYDVPPAINTLLEHLARLRTAFHLFCEKEKKYPRGYRYLKAAGADIHIDDFSGVVFCNFFYLHRTQKSIMKTVCVRGKGVFFLQGSQEEWSVLEELARDFGEVIRPEFAKASVAPGLIGVAGVPPSAAKPEIFLHPSFDLHSEVGLLRETLKTVANLEKTVVVLPDAEALIPVLSEVASVTDDLNVSMGYPLKRSSLYVLLAHIFKVQETTREGAYYTRDYLKLISHPLVKNLDCGFGAAATRILVHKIEEILCGQAESSLGGALFVRLAELEESFELVEYARAALGREEEKIDAGAVRQMLALLHRRLFLAWEGVRTFGDFAGTLEEFLDFFLERSPLSKYPLNVKAADRVFSLALEMRSAAFCGEEFPSDEMFGIFQDALEAEHIAFAGSPLSGLQILGLFETRELTFEDVLILDVNEGVLPKLKVYEPLIPRDVLAALGLARLEKEEEIQRYHFLRLAASARRLHLFYREGADRERSRFIEEIIWRRQREGAPTEAALVGPGFLVKVSSGEIYVEKKALHIEYLKKMRYSASSLNTYLACPLRFYYQYVLSLSEREALEDEPEAADIGNFIHKLLEEAFAEFVGRRPVIDAAFRRRFFRRMEALFEHQMIRRMRGDAFLLKEVLDFRLNLFLDFEARRPLREVVALEKTLQGEMALGGLTPSFKCRIDRIDRLDDNSLLVIDYKTGGGALPLSCVKIKERGFEREHLKKTMRSFQLPLYLYFVRGYFPGETVNAALYYLKEAGKDTCLKKLFADNEEAAAPQEFLDVFSEALSVLFAEILNPGIPFKADPGDARACSLCSFFYLCRERIA